MEKKPPEFADIDEEDLLKDDKHPRYLNKIIVLVVGIFMLLLMLSYLLPLEHIGSIVQSKKINENLVVKLKNSKRIQFSENVFNNIKTRFATEKNEFKVCLLGKKIGNNYFIDDSYNPKIFSSSFRHVTSVGCNDDTLISMHSHPSMFCIFSRQDIKSYEMLKGRNKDTFIGIICGPDRFNFFGYG